MITLFQKPEPESMFWKCRCCSSHSVWHDATTSWTKTSENHGSGPPSLRRCVKLRLWWYWPRSPQQWPVSGEDSPTFKSDRKATLVDQRNTGLTDSEMTCKKPKSPLKTPWTKQVVIDVSKSGLCTNTRRMLGRRRVAYSHLFVL